MMTRKGETDTVTGRFASGQDFDLRKIGSRMLRTARLSSETFRELRNDPRATAQSVSIIAIVGACYGGGLGLSEFFVSGISLLEIFAITLVGLLAALVIAFVWSGMTFLVVTRLFRRTIDFWGLARPIFFSWSPGVLFVLTSSPIPVISVIVPSIGTAWIGVASVFAVKHAVGLSTQQSMLTFIISVFVLAFIRFLIPV